MNTILCALVRAALNATLLPELVAHLVRLGLWDEAAARDYAASYLAQANRQTLLALLAQPDQAPSFPAGSVAADSAAYLASIAQLPPAARQPTLESWQRSYEQAGDVSDTRGDQDRLTLLIAALSQPPLSGTERVPPGEFAARLAALRGYSAPPPAR